MPRQLNTQDYKQVIKRLHLGTVPSSFSANNYMLKCPYHNDKHPSLSINIKNGTYQCFQCHRSGHLASLVLDRTQGHTDIYGLLGIDTHEDSYERYLEAAHLETEPQVDYSTLIDEKTLEDVKIVSRGLIVPYQESPEALEYLAKRYIPLEFAESLGMYFADEALINEMYYYKRLCIPIYDATGHLINIEGRDTTFTQQRKCIYPKRSIKPLFEWYKLDIEKPVFIFEGLIKLLVARTDDYFANSTTNFGTYFSDLQAQQLKNFKNIVIVPDNDIPGYQFIKQVYRHAVEGATISILRIINPDIKDADEIPGKSGMSVKDFRLSGGFMEEINFL